MRMKTNRKGGLRASLSDTHTSSTQKIAIEKNQPCIHEGSMPRHIDAVHFSDVAFRMATKVTRD